MTSIIYTWNLNPLTTVVAIYDQNKSQASFKIRQQQNEIIPERIISDVKLRGPEPEMTNLFEKTWAKVVDGSNFTTLHLYLKLFGGGKETGGVLSSQKKAVQDIGLCDGDKEVCEKRIKRLLPSSTYGNVTVLTKDHRFKHANGLKPTRIVELRFSNWDSVCLFFRHAKSIFSSKEAKRLNESKRLRESQSSQKETRLISAILGSQNQLDQKELIAAFDGRLDLTLYVAMDLNQIELAFTRYREEGSSDENGNKGSCCLQ